MGSGTLRILVADDDPDVLSDVAAVLEEPGATVTRAGSGAALGDKALLLQKPFGFADLEGAITRRVPAGIEHRAS